MTTNFKQSDKKLIQEFFDIGFWKLSEKKQHRWRFMMAMSDKFIEEYSKELDLRTDVEKAIKEKDVIELREKINKITGS